LEDKIKSRYSGKEDPLATKIIEKVHEFKIPDPPEDPNITTLFIGGLNEQSPEVALREQFEIYGKIQGLRVIPSKNCAFISFVERQACEKAFNTLYERLYLKNTSRKLKLLWAIVKLKNLIL
jgi:pre-mRNA-splicing factor RBM22/SLT11